MLNQQHWHNDVWSLSFLKFCFVAEKHGVLRNSYWNLLWGCENHIDCLCLISSFFLQNFKVSLALTVASDEDYIDEETGIPYKSDKDLIDTGIVKTVSPNHLKIFHSHKRTWEAFPQGTRNCYTLRPEQGKNNNYLIRARFVYGNYDGENQKPIFDLHLGVNERTTVDLTNSGA